jgi:CubicO group peptidase (beta-lactamase class C family)
MIMDGLSVVCANAITPTHRDQAGGAGHTPVYNGEARDTTNRVCYHLDHHGTEPVAGDNVRRANTSKIRRETVMRVLFAAVFVLLVVCACAQEGTDHGIAQKISGVESGLIELDVANFNPAALFDPNSTQLANPRTLAERMEAYNVPGVSIAVINNNQIEWTKTYGSMDVDTGAPVTTETIFEAGSTSKLVTAVMALHFVEQGLIDLDEDVNHYLTSWKVPENEFTSEQKVNLRHLLTQRAGMPESGYDTDDSGNYPTLIDVLNGAPPADNAPATPETTPGTRWHYSNVAFNVIQLLLEDVSGKSFEQVARELVFQPLGMGNSTFLYPLDAERKKREAMPHDAEGISREPLMHRTALSHGGLTTTPTDLAKFTVELMLSYQGKSEKIISQEMTRRMFRNVCEIDRQRFPLPFTQGLGAFIAGEGEELHFCHPGSNNPGLQCWLTGWPERGTGTVIMTNGANGIFLEIEIINAVIQEYNS